MSVVHEGRPPARAGYVDLGSGAFAAALECAEQLRRRRASPEHLELTQQMSATKVRAGPTKDEERCIQLYHGTFGISSETSGCPGDLATWCSVWSKAAAGAR